MFKGWSAADLKSRLALAGSFIRWGVGSLDLCMWLHTDHILPGCNHDSTGLLEVTPHPPGVWSRNRAIKESHLCFLSWFFFSLKFLFFSHFIVITCQKGKKGRRNYAFICWLLGMHRPLEDVLWTACMEWALLTAYTQSPFSPLFLPGKTQRWWRQYM